MEAKTFDTMREATFDTLLDTMGVEEFGDLTTDQFYTALDSLRSAETEDTLEIAATVREGQLVFEQPAPLNVHTNVNYVSAVSESSSVSWGKPNGTRPDLNSSVEHIVGNPACQTNL